MHLRSLICQIKNVFFLFYTLFMIIMILLNEGVFDTKLTEDILLKDKLESFDRGRGIEPK